MTARRRLAGLTLLLVASAAGAARTQPADRAAAARAQIDRIFEDRAYDPPRFGPARWVPGAAAYIIVERDARGGADLVRYDAASGTRTVVVAAARLTPPGHAPLDVDDYAPSSDGRRLLIFTNTAKVWRRNTRGDYWVLDAPSGTLTQLGTRQLP